MKLLGVLVAIGGIAFALYFGFWVMFIGGIMAIIHNWATITAGLLAWSIIKIFFASTVGSLIAWGSVVLGNSLYNAAE